MSGHATRQLEAKVHGFYSSIATMFEAWLARRKSHNTRRAYRRDVMDFTWTSQEQPQPDES